MPHTSGTDAEIRYSRDDKAAMGYYVVSRSRLSSVWWRNGRSARECVLLLFLWGVFCPTLPTRMEGMAVFHPLNVGTTRLPWAIMSFRERGAHVTPPPHPCGGATAVKSARVGFSPKSLIPNGTATVTDVGQCARVTHTKRYSDCNGLGGVVP